MRVSCKWSVGHQGATNHGVVYVTVSITVIGQLLPCLCNKVLGVAVRNKHPSL